MTEAPDSPSQPDRSGASDGTPPSRDEPAGDRGRRLDVEADPLEELRRRQHEAREGREREARRREQEQREHEARIREERRRKREQLEREPRERAARRRKPETPPDERGSLGAGGPRPSSWRSESDVEAPGTRRSGDETRPLPSVESSATDVPATAAGAEKPSDAAPPRKPRAPASRAQPPPSNTSVDEQLATKPVERSVRPEPAPTPPAPKPGAETKPERSAGGATDRALADEAAVPRLRAVRVPGGPVHRRLTGVDPRSIFKLALAFYLGVLVTAVAGGTVLWFLLTAAGVIGNVESFIGELFGYEDFEFIFSRILVVSVLVGLVWVVLSAGLTSLLAVIYNRASRFTGGLEVTFDDTDA